MNLVPCLMPLWLGDRNYQGYENRISARICNKTGAGTCLIGNELGIDALVVAVVCSDYRDTLLGTEARGTARGAVRVP